MIFEVDDGDYKDAYNHDCKLPKDEHGQPSVGAIGGRITVSFTATGIGVITKLSCACGWENDVTPYDDW